MLSRARRWLDRQKRAAARKPAIRIDGVEVASLDDGRGYQAVITGFNLYAVISPPRVTIGGEPLLDMAFGKDGRTIRGRLRHEPADQHVEVDYGFARAEL